MTSSVICIRELRSEQKEIPHYAAIVSTTTNNPGSMYMKAARDSSTTTTSLAMVIPEYGHPKTAVRLLRIIVSTEIQGLAFEFLKKAGAHSRVTTSQRTFKARGPLHRIARRM